MSVTGIILAAVIVGGTGLFIGVFLGVAGKKFAVEVDEREEVVLKRQEMLDKEVYDIVHRNKKMAASDVRKNREKNCAAGKDKEKTVPHR